MIQNLVVTERPSCTVAESPGISPIAQVVLRMGNATLSAGDGTGGWASGTEGGWLVDILVNGTWTVSSYRNKPR